MSQLQLLSTDEAATADLPWPDVYFSPFYGKAVEQSENAVWEIAVWRNGEILYPYLKRRVDPSLAQDEWFDIVSPYGYAGTWAAETVSADGWREFRRDLRATLRGRGVIAEFQRVSGLVSSCSLLLEADPDVDAAHHNDTVAIDVRSGYEACWAKAEGRSRTKTRKAQRLGYRWSTRHAAPTDVSADSSFRVLYEETMRRVGASEYYYFCDAYYDLLQSGLGDRLRLLEVHNTAGDTVVSGLFMLWEPFVHLHLLGSNPEAVRDGAGNLAYDGLIRWACHQGPFTYVHVGGGKQRNDRMYYFKRGFGGIAVPFWIAKSVIHAERYDALVGARAADLCCRVEQLASAGYFPAYRCRRVPGSFAA